MIARIRSLPWPVLIGISLLMIHGFVNSTLSFFYQDEAAYAGFGLTMIQTDNWLIPEFEWSSIHRKPPLYFWLIASSYSLFGVSEFTMRLPALLSLIGLYATLWFWGKRILGPRIAGWSVLVLSTSLFVPLLGIMALVDAPLLLMSTLAACCVYTVLQSPHNHWRAIFGFWACISAGVLLKGPPIIIFGGMLGLLALILHPQRWRLLSLHPWIFGPLSLLPFALWAYATARVDNGALLSWMLDWYVLRRINGSTLGHWGPPGYYTLSFLLFFMPYALFIPQAVVQGWRWIKQRHAVGLWIVAWFLAGWVFYELSPSKLPAYVVTAHVPLAIAIAYSITTYLDYRPIALRTGQIVHGCITGLWLLILWLVPTYFGFTHTSVIIAGMTLGAGYLGYRIRYAIRANQPDDVVKSTVIQGLGFMLVFWVLLVPMCDSVKSAPRSMARYLHQTVPASTPIIVAHTQYEPIHLLVYLSEHFETVTVFKSPETLVDYYQDNPTSVFVLSDAQFHTLQTSIPALTGRRFGPPDQPNMPVLRYTVVVPATAQ